MKKLLKKALTLMLVSIIMLSCVACGGTKADGENVLEIYVYEQGYGIKWVNDLIDAFKEESWVKEKYPDLQILTPVDNRTIEFGENQLALGSKKNTYDLLFTAQLGSYYGTKELLDITDLVYNAKVPGEEVTYAEKLNDSIESAYLFTDIKTGEESYYAVPWQGGMSAILYNKTRLDAMKFDAPRTTDEFIAICESAKNATESVPAIIQSNDTQYCNTFLDVWWAQYDTVSGREDFYNGIDKDGEVSNKIFSDYQGRLKALEIFEELFTFSNGYIDNGSYNDGYMTSQSNFLQGKKGLFHFNGDWFSQEMSATTANLIANNRRVDDIRVLKTPIISAIVDNCSTIMGEAGGTADQELSALVKAIDENIAVLDSDTNTYHGVGYSVSPADFKTVKDARCVVAGVAANTMGVIPSYAKGKNIAVDFLKFMATDKAIAIYTEATYGATVDFTFDVESYDKDLYDSLPQLNKDKINYFKSFDISILRTVGTFPLHVYGTVNAFYNTRYYQSFADVNGSVTALDFYNRTLQEWTVEKFQSAVRNSWD